MTIFIQWVIFLNFVLAGQATHSSPLGGLRLDLKNYQVDALLVALQLFANKVVFPPLRGEIEKNDDYSYLYKGL